MKNVDLDQNAMSDQGLHCLPSSSSRLNIFTGNKIDLFRFKTSMVRCQIYRVNMVNGLR